MPKPLLPSLKAEHNVKNIDTAGVWQSRGAIELDSISTGLDVKQAQIQINSIPDVWARPLLFEMALLNREHPLHKNVLGEWRGLLALIGLKEVKNLTQLTVQNLKINQPKNEDQRFQDALYKLKPNRVLSPDMDWTNLYLFLFNDGLKDHAIGMTSPTTIVCTATSYYNAINSVPWYQNVLVDPSSVLSLREKKLLADWLANLKNNLNSIANSKKEILNHLSTLLDNYIDDLGVQPKPALLATVGLGITGLEAGFFVFLDKPAKAPSVSSADSNVRLIPSGNRAPNVPMLIADANIAQQWRVKNEDVTVYGTVTLANLPFAGLGGYRNQIGNIQVSGAEVWEPKDLFTEKLLVVRSKDAFPEAVDLSYNWQGNSPRHNEAPISIVLPFKSELFNYLDRDDLINNLNLAQDASGAITIILNLKLSGINGSEPKYQLTKTYAVQDFEFLSQLPILELFPKFKTDGWNAYFLAYATDNRRTTFQITPSSQIIRSSEIEINGARDAQRKIYQLSDFPEFIYCEFEGKQAGVLALNAPDKVVSQRVSYTVGIDFGASGTCVYASNGQSEFPVEFSNQKRSITQIAESQRGEVIDLFLPETNIQSPFLSIYQDFSNYTSNNHKALLNGHIYFFNAATATDLDQDNIKTDLKWADDAQLNRYVKSFLTQICLQTTAELVAKGAGSINWNFSYPTAFSQSQVDSYNAIWNQVITECQTDYFELPNENRKPPIHQSESIVSAQYFRDRQDAAVSIGAIFIDIGSSTSDISVWQNNKLLWQTSLRYAGRHIFLNYLSKNLSALSDFGIQLKNLPLHAFYPSVDSILISQSDQIFQSLPLNSNTENIKAIKNHLAFGLAGLFYYIGLGINYLHEKAIYEYEMPQVFVGGNGSKMFSWLSDGGPLHSGNLYHQLFQTCFLKGLNKSDLPGDLRLEISSAPKKEAALGLVSKNILKVDDNYQSVVISGENFSVNKSEYHKWNEILTADLLAKSVGPPTKLEKLNEFIDTFNSFVKKSNLGQPIEVTSQRLSTIRGMVANDLSSMSKNTAINVEPIFILELKHLLGSF